MNNSTKDVKNLVAEILNEAADVLTTGKALSKTKVGITVLGSEHGINEVVLGAESAQNNSNDIEVVIIGPADIATKLKIAPAASEEECHLKMEELLDSGAIDAAVTMHYNFPIGTSTVGLVKTPGRGKKMFIATTTGTSAADRVEGMVKNAVYGTAVAKAYGIPNPTVGILNVDGSRQVERILNSLKTNGYDITFAASQRADGGIVMRGNDLLAGVPDVMVTDSLTGNLLMKLFSAFTTGGSYESTGYGYGPGVGEGLKKIINIISRASGAPVIAGAIEYAAKVVRGNLIKIADSEIACAKKAGMLDLTKPKNTPPVNASIKAPPHKIVSQQIAGIDVLEIEDAQQLLWKNSIYAETGMGCTGPVILVASDDHAAALAILKSNNFINRVGGDFE